MKNNYKREEKNKVRHWQEWQGLDQPLRFVNNLCNLVIYDHQRNLELIILEVTESDSKALEVKVQKLLQRSVQNKLIQ